LISTLIPAVRDVLARFFFASCGEKAYTIVNMTAAETKSLSFFDVHTHLHDPRISGDIQGILRRAGEAGVTHMATCATMEENFQTTKRLARSKAPVVPCFGIHPWFLDTLSRNWETVLGEQLEKIPSAVGETGLDFMDRGADRDLQRSVFKTHLSLAMDLGRPVNIHIRKAWDAFVHILKETGPLKVGGVVHSYSGSADLVRVLTGYNLHISFSGAATRPHAKKATKAILAVPLDRIVFETDTPDLFPSLETTGPLNPKPLNEPMYVRDIVRICATLREMPFEKLAEHGYANARHLFEPLLP